MKRASFVRFLLTTIGLVLTPGQRVVCEVLFDGRTPAASSNPTLAGQIFGLVAEIPRLATAIVELVCGRGAGKSYVFGALRLLFLGLTADLRGLAPGEHGFGIIVAPSMKLGRQTLRFIIGAVQANTRLARLVVVVREDAVTLRRSDGCLITFECFAASARGSEMRGKSIFGAVLDECAIFRDENYVVCDREIFSAIVPRLRPDGQIILASTPWSKEGLFHELYVQNFGHPVTALVAHAPTLLLRDDDDTRQMVEREQLRDEPNYEREFLARFIDTGAGSFFDARTIDGSIEREITQRHTRPTLAVGADFGFRSDASACVVVAMHAHVFEVLHVDELRPTKDSPLDFNEVVDRFAAIASQYAATSITADLHYAEAIRARLRERGIDLRAAPEGASGKLETYVAAKALFGSELVSLPNHPRLVAQLKAVQSRPTSGGGLSITSPRLPGGGGHGDIVSALILGLHAARRLRVRERNQTQGARPPPLDLTGRGDGGRYGVISSRAFFNDGDNPTGCVSRPARSVAPLPAPIGQLVAVHQPSAETTLPDLAAELASEIPNP